MSKQKFNCPLQVAFNKILDEDMYDDYYNANCITCNNNRPPEEKSFEENVHDVQLTFKLLPLMTDIEECEKLSKKDLFDEVAKRGGMYN